MCVCVCVCVNVCVCVCVCGSLHSSTKNVPGKILVVYTDGPSPGCNSAARWTCQARTGRWRRWPAGGRCGRTGGRASHGGT